MKRIPCVRCWGPLLWKNPSPSQRQAVVEIRKRSKNPQFWVVFFLQNLSLGLFYCSYFLVLSHSMRCHEWLLETDIALCFYGDLQGGCAFIVMSVDKVTTIGGLGNHHRGPKRFITILPIGSSSMGGCWVPFDQYGKEVALDGKGNHFQICAGHLIQRNFPLPQTNASDPSQIKH